MGEEQTFLWFSSLIVPLVFMNLSLLPELSLKISALSVSPKIKPILSYDMIVIVSFLLLSLCFNFTTTHM